MGDLGFEPRFEGLKVLCNHLYTNHPKMARGVRIELTQSDLESNSPALGHGPASLKVSQFTQKSSVFILSKASTYQKNVSKFLKKIDK